MTNRNPLPWPIWMIALGIVGTLPLALGLFDLFGDYAADALSPADVQSLAITFIVIGTLLMLPLAVSIVRQVLDSQRSA